MKAGFLAVESSFTNSGSLIVIFTTLRCKKVNYSIRILQNQYIICIRSTTQTITNVQITYLPTVPNFSCILSMEKSGGRFSTKTVLFCKYNMVSTPII